MFAIIQTLKGGVPVITSMHHTFNTAISYATRERRLHPNTLPTIQLVTTVIDGTYVKEYSFTAPNSYAIDQYGRICKREI